MDEFIFSNIVAASSKIAEKAQIEKIRESSAEIVEKISQNNSGLFVIHGLRGVGKTTILVRLSKITNNSIYLSGDVILKYAVDFLEILNYCDKIGYKLILVDEVHAIPNWEKDAKIFYDQTTTKLVLTGSSAAALRTRGSELSRRAMLFEIRPLSFREYLIFKTGKHIQKVTIEEILNETKRQELSKWVIAYKSDFEEYISKHGLPASFFQNRQDVYMNIIERIVRYDLEILHSIDIHYIDAAFKIIKFIATSSPGELSYSGLSSSIGRSIKFTKEAVNILSLAGLLYIIPPQGAGHKVIRSEDKILMPLSFRSALCQNYGIKPSEGGLREDFFIQHVKEAQYIKTGAERRTPDFAVGNYIFEIGGPSKGWDQLKGKKNAYLVKESLTIEKNEIPLYLFGFLY
ncbi:MAG: AAA family ATPase [Candidatus Micrarchaeota archaeon]